MTNKWEEFRRKYGLHNGTDPLEYASGVFQATQSLIKSTHEHQCATCDLIKAKIDHLEELKNALNTFTPCRICGKDSQISTGWHLDNGLNFCNNGCVSKYLEKFKVYNR